MKIVVCIKQVPETSNVRMDPETGTMVREGVESIVNPLDLYAIETALRLKEAHGGEVMVVSMGPPAAERAIREALAMGCDRGVLVSGREFAGSDTHATSYALSQALRRLTPWDMALAGVRATDGDTGQVGPGLAAFLDLPLATEVSRILNVEDGVVTVDRLVEAGYETLRLPLPCLLTVVKEICFPRLPTLRGKQRARQAEVPTWNAADLGLDASLLGLKGSPTRVRRIERPKVARQGVNVVVEKVSADEAARQLADFLESRNLL
jgi:electron transfer flavoprotein beta subunit